MRLKKPSGLLIALFLCIIITSFLVFHPVPDLFDGNKWGALFRTRDSLWVRFFLCLALFTLGGLLFIPLNLMVVLASTVVPGVQALIFILTSALLSALVGYWQGRLLSMGLLEKLLPKKMQVLKSKLKTDSALPIVFFRLTPVAPFSLINIFAGSIQLDIKKYLLGTFLGLLPGVVSITLLQKSMLQVFENPDPETLIWFFVTLGGLALILILLNRRIGPYDS